MTTLWKARANDASAHPFRSDAVFPFAQARFASRGCVTPIGLGTMPGAGGVQGEITGYRPSPLSRIAMVPISQIRFFRPHRRSTTVFS